METFCKLCQKALALNHEIKDKAEKKLKSSKLVNELLKLEFKTK